MDLASMSHLVYFIWFLFICFTSAAQKRWDGGGGDGQWNNPANWVGNTLPVSTDDIMLDNSAFASSYSVTLPGGNIAVTVKSVFIAPGINDSIELILPSSNTSLNAFTVTGPGYGMTINIRGIFRNASGSTLGTPVNIMDSIRIKNGGKWIHNTSAGHAANVQALSGISGTEKGIFEFDVPVASTTISLSGRTFGKLAFRSAAAGGTINYTAAGTSKVKIRSDLEINPGVTLALNFSDTISIDGDYIQNGGIFNMGTTARSVVVALNKNIVQATGANITETGTGVQELWLKGSQVHNIDMKGIIMNQVGFTLDVQAACTLSSSLNLPYKLTLRKGALTTTATNLLHLLSGCSAAADTLSNNSYIDGPMKKDALNASDFTFPVGKSGMMRWVMLKSATGNYTVEYFRKDPYTLSTNIGSGLHHVSHLEYWNVTSDIQTNSSSVITSFNDPQSGGVTNPSNLRVARLMNGIWENAGNTAFGGSAGSNGWVSSAAASGFSAPNNYFALSSSTGQENPLPLFSVALRAERKADGLLFTWDAPLPDPYTFFELESSFDNKTFGTVTRMATMAGVKSYSFQLSAFSSGQYYRIRAIDENGSCFISRTISILERFTNGFELMGTGIAHTQLHLSVRSSKTCNVQLIITDVHERIRKKINISARQGLTNVEVDLSGLSAGMYYIFGLSPVNRTNTFKFIKL